MEGLRSAGWWRRTKKGEAEYRGNPDTLLCYRLFKISSPIYHYPHNTWLHGDRKMEYFHISKTSGLKTLTPQIPKAWTLPVAGHLEDFTVPRVSLCPNIRACVIALQLRESDLEKGGSLYYVYKTNRSIKVIDNATLVKEKRIFDAHITEEVWCTQDTTVILVGTLRVFPNSVAAIRYRPLIKGKELTQLQIADKEGYLTAYLWDYTWDRFNIKEKDSGYREGSDSVFEADGECFSVDALLNESTHFPIEYFSVKRLLDTFNLNEMDSDVDQKRVRAADLKVPVLVTDYVDGIIMPMDGAHRTWRAHLDGVDYLPGKYMTSTAKRKARVSCKVSGSESIDKGVTYLNW